MGETPQATARQAPRRKSRREARQETRSRLLDAAHAVFTDKGYAAASVEEIALRAGYTRGAFYSNFTGKDDVFFALMDARMAERVAEVTKVMASASPLTVFSDLDAWSRQARDDDELARLRLSAEFRAHALRNDAARRQLAARDETLRSAYVRAITALFEAAGSPLPAPAADLAVLVQVLDTYLPLQKALDPDSFREGLLFDLLTLLYRAGLALADNERGG